MSKNVQVACDFYQEHKSFFSGLQITQERVLIACDVIACCCGSLPCEPHTIEIQLNENETFSVKYFDYNIEDMELVLYNSVACKDVDLLKAELYSLFN